MGCHWLSPVLAGLASAIHHLLSYLIRGMTKTNNQKIFSETPLWLSTLIDALKSAPGARLKGLMGGSRAFALAMLSRMFPLAILPADLDDMERWSRGMSAWLGAEEGDSPDARVHPIPPRPEPRLFPPHSDDAGDPVRYASLAALDISPGGELRGLQAGRGTSGYPVYIIPPATLLQRIPVGGAARLLVKPGMNLDRDELMAKLLEGGYQPAALVYERGEVRTSGEIVDIFPPRGAPVRIELEYDKVSRVRSFDPATQRSLEPLEQVGIDPVSEVPLDEEHRLRALERMKGPHFDAASEEGAAVIERLKTAGLEPEDIRRYLIWFAEKTSSILDRLPPDTVLVTPDGTALDEVLKTLLEGIGKEHWEHADRAILPLPEEVFFSLEEIKSRMMLMLRLELGGPVAESAEEWPVVTASAVSNEDIHDEIQKALHDPEHEGRVLASLVKRVEGWRREKWRVALTCLDGVGAARLESLLQEYGLSVTVSSAPKGLLDQGPEQGAMGLYLSPLAEGFRMAAAGWAVVTEEEIFGPKVRRREARKTPSEEEVETLEPDKPVVHIDHGIGLFRKIEKLSVGGFDGDYLKIEYLENAILYLPVHRMNLVEPYRSDADDLPELDRLGGKAWAKSIARARKSIETIARELVELYAGRRVFEGFSYPAPDATFHEFEASFPYEETPDQARAINDVLNDMQSPRSMDRIICGDVGYGKTEVALRAAFEAGMCGKQVALLVPTTLLAHQHYRTFSERIKPYPLRVEMLSRFRSAHEQREIIKQLAQGGVDIIIGTHRLLQKDVEFRDLGLVIIDEEHRFGVKNKEKLKQMRRTVDVLSLTATPIPRTLQMSLLGVWDMSVMDTPPPDRLSVRTRVAPFGEDIIRDAIRRELARGGQVFFVHNRIQGIERVEQLLRDIVPEARMAVAHGQMDNKRLEEVMLSFIKGDLDVLISTAIIESGLDIPRANTILINRAHTFGMATLYQLRGRVGRSKERGYSYLLIPGRHLITRQARERLRALEEFSELGSGYRLARLDLKIRGAGNILGEVQSGHIHRVGYDMYLGMLERAVKEIRGESVKEEIDPEIQVNVAAFLPEEYITDPDSRILFYRRLAKTRNNNEILDLKGELLDRFGPLPEQAETLLQIISLKNVLRPSRVTTLRKEGRAHRLSFAPDAPVDPLKVVTLLNKHPQKYRVAPNDQFLFIPEKEGIPQLIQEITYILKEIRLNDILQ